MLMIQTQDNQAYKHIYFEESKIKFKIAYLFVKYVLYNGHMYELFEN